MSSGKALWLVSAEHSNFRIESFYDVLQIGMSTRHDDGDKILHTLVYYHFGFDVKQFALLSSHKPSQEQTVALCLLVVGTIAHIEHDVGVGTEELYDDTYHCLAYLRVAGRGLTAAIRKIEPIGGYRVEERLLLKTHGINNVVVCAEDVFAVVQFHRMGTVVEQMLWIKFLHTVSILKKGSDLARLICSSISVNLTSKRARHSFLYSR